MTIIGRTNINRRLVRWLFPGGVDYPMYILIWFPCLSEGLLNAGHMLFFSGGGGGPLGLGGLIWLASLASTRSASRLAILWSVSRLAISLFRPPTCQPWSVSQLTAPVLHVYVPKYVSVEILPILVWRTGRQRRVQGSG